MPKKVVQVAVVAPVPVPPTNVVPIGPPNFDPFGVSPNLEIALTARQSDAINKKATHREICSCQSIPLIY